MNDAILREKQRRLRKLKQQQARTDIDTRPQIETEIEDLEAEIAKLEGSTSAVFLPRPHHQHYWPRATCKGSHVG